MYNINQCGGNAIPKIHLHCIIYVTMQMALLSRYKIFNVEMAVFGGQVTAMYSVKLK